jgi:cell wall-associated NlpC family hydrolase
MSKRDDFLKVIRTREDCPYIWAAKGPDNFDCSGLVTWGFKESGGPDMRLNYNADRLFNLLEETETPRPGDLCFYGHKGHASHVMVYIGPLVYGATGGNSGTHTAVSHAKVQYRSGVNYRPDLLGYRKLPFE